MDLAAYCILVSPPENKQKVRGDEMKGKEQKSTELKEAFYPAVLNWVRLGTIQRMRKYTHARAHAGTHTHTQQKQINIYIGPFQLFTSNRHQASNGGQVQSSTRIPPAALLRWRSNVSLPMFVYPLLCSFFFLLLRSLFHCFIFSSPLHPPSSRSDQPLPSPCLPDLAPSYFPVNTLHNGPLGPLQTSCSLFVSQSSFHHMCQSFKSDGH